MTPEEGRQQSGIVKRATASPSSLMAMALAFVYCCGFVVVGHHFAEFASAPVSLADVRYLAAGFVALIVCGAPAIVGPLAFRWVMVNIEGPLPFKVIAFIFLHATFLLPWSGGFMTIIAVDRDIPSEVTFFVLTTAIGLYIWHRVSEWRNTPEGENDFHDMVVNGFLGVLLILAVLVAFSEVIYGTIRKEYGGGSATMISLNNEDEISVFHFSEDAHFIHLLVCDDNGSPPVHRAVPVADMPSYTGVTRSVSHLLGEEITRSFAVTDDMCLSISVPDSTPSDSIL